MTMLNITDGNNNISRDGNNNNIGFRRDIAIDITELVQLLVHHDTLCKDMQVPHKRKSNPLAELFMPYQANDYAAIFK